MPADEAVVVGRRSELEVLRSFIDRIGEGAAAFVVSGPGGIGKTTLWRAGVEFARAAGCRVLVARPSSVEARLSFAGLADLFAPLEPELFDRLPGPQRRALDVALLRQEPKPGKGRTDSRAVMTASASLLRKLAEERSLMLAVDDAQWLDAATDVALRFALRRLPDIPLCVLSSVRVEGSGRPDTFDAAVAAERRVEVTLAPLSLAAVHDILREELGQSLPRPTLVKVVQLSGGNPFYAIEIARELGRLGVTTAAGHLPIPPDVRALVGARVARLPKRTRDALLLASSAAVPTTAFIDEKALASAEDAALIEIDRGGRIRFTHPLVAAAVYDTGGAAQRREAHRALADRVEDRGERARHLALATSGCDDAVAAVLDDAAVHAASRGASAAAADLARLALDLTEGGGEPKVRRSRALAHYLLDAGDTAGAHDVLQACDPESVDGGARAELLLQLGELLWFENDWERGYRLVLEALEHARNPELAAKAHRAAAWLSQDVDPARAIAHADAAVALLDPERSPGAYSSVLLHSAYLRLIDGRGADDDAYRRGRALQEQNIDWDDASPVIGMWPLFKDDFSDAKQFFEAGLERSRAEGDEPSVQGTLVRLTEIACWTGDWENADRLAAEGVELAARVGSTAYLGSALYARALVDAHVGRVEEARAGGERIVELFATGTHAALGHWVLGFVALSLEQSALADEHLTRAAALVAALGHREPARFRFHPDHVEAVIELGDLDRARVLLDALEERARIFPRPWIAGAVARCRALLLATQGDLEAGLQAIGSSLQRPPAAMPFEQARTMLVEGKILRRLKQKRRARTALEEALAILQELGAELWVQRAQGELARVVVRGAAGGLSPTELKIARLAADGLTNQAIAAEVFVSQKTVEANLARAYRKLGIRSRAQLSRALEEQARMIS